MKNASARCSDDLARRDEVRRRKWNGIDYVEVGDDQTTLCVHFLAAVPALAAENFVIRGGSRITDVRVESVGSAVHKSANGDTCLDVYVNKFGDFSTYTLCVVKTDADGRSTGEPPNGFDPVYACVDFTFKANCPSPLDCGAVEPCPQPPRSEPEISYLAKDYATFRELMLDRLALIMPEWRERHEPDLGIAVIEVLAYVADYLSYYQDAVATEAYIDTARLRTSVRRHARLVDYRMHEGCNARAWVFLETSSDVTLDAAKVAFVTEWLDRPPTTDPVEPEELRGVPAERYVWFEPLAPTPRIELRAAHNTIAIYTWRKEQCCLEAGATRAVLTDTWIEEPQDPGKNGKTCAHEYACGCHPDPPKPPERKRTLRLGKGDYLLFEERRCSSTGGEAGADKSHRHVVRLTRLEEKVDVLYDQPLLEVEWAREDALPFALCLSAIGPAPECNLIDGISVARGNVILADHGRTRDGEVLGVVGAASTEIRCEGVGELEERTLHAAPFRPALERAPLTFSERLRADAPAAAQIAQDPKNAVPGATLRAIPPAPLDALFDEDDLAAPEQLAARVRAGADRVARNLRRHLSAETITLLERWDGGSSLPAEARGELIEDLLRLAIEGTQPEPLFDVDDFGAPEGLAFRMRQNRDAGAFVLRAYLSPDELAFVDAFTGKLTPPLETILRELMESLLQEWTAEPDLLASGGDDRHFVAEIDDDGRAHIRFGDDDTGRAPEPGTAFLARYRVGNGIAGNVGAEALSRLVLIGTGVSGATIRVRNPLPARGGTAAQPVAEVRALAPREYRTRRQRAIVAEDYAELAGLDRYGVPNRDVQKAAAELAWNGSWPVASVLLDRAGATAVETPLRDDVFANLHRVRRMGHDLVVGAARYAPVEVALNVLVHPQHARADVLREILAVFSNRVLPNGRRGFFHPDELTFGMALEVSGIVAAAQSVEGVAGAKVTQLRRMQSEQVNPDFPDGLLKFGPLEIPRLDNDPNEPENGVLTIDIGGGR